MSVNLQSLADQVRHEVETYEIPAPHPQQVGEILPASWFEEGLAHMRGALIEPYWVDVQAGRLEEVEVTRRVLIVADDQAETLVAYDPNSDGDFSLLTRTDGRIYDCHVGGDVVGCFLSR